MGKVDFGQPPFTQKKCTCHVVLSDDDDVAVGVTIYFSFVSSRPHPVFILPHHCHYLTSPHLLCHLITLSPCHLVISPHCHIVTLSSHYITTLSPCHLTTSPSYHLFDHIPSLSFSPCPCLVLVPTLSLSSFLPCLCILLRIPFLGHCICPSLAP